MATSSNRLHDNSEKVHLVKKGETLGEIAKKELGAANKWPEIAALNNIKKPYRIQVGDRLKVPSKESSEDESSIKKTPVILPSVENGPAKSSKIVKVECCWISQFDPAVPGYGEKACYRACGEMMKRAGVTIGANTNDRIQVAIGEKRDGSVIIDPNKLKEATSYIDQELKAGRPVTVGISHKDTTYNQDKITDHFVVIFAKGIDRNGPYYSYHDPCVSKHNYNKVKGHCFRVAADDGNLVFGGVPNAPKEPLWGKNKELSMVIINRDHAKSEP